MRRVVSWIPLEAEAEKEIFLRILWITERREGKEEAREGRRRRQADRELVSLPRGHLRYPEEGATHHSHPKLGLRGQALHNPTFSTEGGLT